MSSFSSQTDCNRGSDAARRPSAARNGSDEAAMWVATWACDRGEVSPEIMILNSASLTPVTHIFEVC